ncbi:hypothetical protein EKD04_023720 [Chloroflexales bacterium ZM16-3]|nr:hypothetical protein [Chloroflexales bacterium ZM16-3]
MSSAAWCSRIATRAWRRSHCPLTCGHEPGGGSARRGA